MELPNRQLSSGRIVGCSFSRFRRTVLSPYFAYFTSGEDEIEDDGTRTVEIEFQVIDGDEIVVLSQCIQALQEWRAEIQEQFLSGNEPMLSLTRMERLPHEQDEAQAKQRGGAS